MSQDSNVPIDMARFTFTVNPEHRGQIEEYLRDLGLDVVGHDDGRIVATWEEPEGSLDEAIGHLWEINGEPFEVTAEEFHRTSLLVYHHEPDAEGHERAVA